MKELFEGFIEKLWPLFPFYPPWAKVIFALCFASVLVAVFVFGTWYSTAAAAREGFVTDTELVNLALEARKATHADKPNDAGAVQANSRYVIQEATMVVRLENTDAQHVADVRIFYTLFALDPLTAADFDEEYHSMGGAKVVAYLAGSENEHLNEPTQSMKRYSVDVEVPRGGRLTLMTAARFFYDLPLAARQVHQFAVSGTEDAWCYPNERDFIGQLTIIVESDSLDFVEPRSGDASMWDKATGTVKPGAPVRRRSESEAVKHNLLLARWVNVRPGTRAGLKVGWKPAGQNGP